MVEFRYTQEELDNLASQILGLVVWQLKRDGYCFKTFDPKKYSENHAIIIRPKKWWKKLFKDTNNKQINIIEKKN